jgi:hypothetical protein
MNEVILREPRPLQDGYYEHLIVLTRQLEKRLKSEDSLRISVTVISFHEIDNGTGFGDIPDVHRMDLYFGWYYETLSSWGRYLDSLRQARPYRVYIQNPLVLGSVAQRTAHRGKRRCALLVYRCFGCGVGFDVMFNGT